MWCTAVPPAVLPSRGPWEHQVPAQLRLLHGRTPPRQHKAGQQGPGYQWDAPLGHEGAQVTRPDEEHEDLHDDTQQGRNMHMVTLEACNMETEEWESVRNRVKFHSGTCGTAGQGHGTWELERWDERYPAGVQMACIVYCIVNSQAMRTAEKPTDGARTPHAQHMYIAHTAT